MACGETNLTSNKNGKLDTPIDFSNLRHGSNQVYHKILYLAINKYLWMSSLQSLLPIWLNWAVSYCKAHKLVIKSIWQANSSVQSTLRSQQLYLHYSGQNQHLLTQDPLRSSGTVDISAVFWPRGSGFKTLQNRNPLLTYNLPWNSLVHFNDESKRFAAYHASSLDIDINQDIWTAGNKLDITKRLA